jgi:chitinase
MLRRTLGLLVILTLGIASCLVPPRPEPPREPRVAAPRVVLGYSAAWTDADYPPAEYDYASLTHIARSFLQPHADGHVTASADFWNEDLKRLAKQHGVKLLASVGGAAPDAAHWLGMVRDERARARFFDELGSLISEHQYDGVDIDWEPSAQTDADQRTYTELMVALRQRFPTWIISTALGTGDWHAKHVSWRQIADQVDFINLMTYSFAGPWSGHSGHNANLDPPSSFSDSSGLSVAANVRQIIERYGVPAQKLTLGLPFYGIQFSTDRLGQAFPARARYKGGELNYTQIERLSHSSEYAASWDEGAAAPYLLRKTGGHTLSFDDPRSIAEKCAFASKLGLAGVMIWYLGADVVRGSPALQHSLARTYGLPRTPARPPFLISSHTARKAQIERLQIEIGRERGELQRRSAPTNSKIAAAGVPASFAEPARDPAELERQLGELDRVLAALEVERAAVQNSLAELPPVRGQAVPFSGSSLLFADFEGDLKSALGGSWSASFDKNGLGTTMLPDPPAWSDGGKNGRAWHTWGHFGKSRAPWPFAALVASFPVTDFEPVAALRFWARGNGKRYSVALQRSSVHDYAFPLALFEAPAEWTRVELPLSAFAQPSWGQQVPGPYGDVIGVAFAPGPQFDDEPFELWIDEVELLKATR